MVGYVLSGVAVLVGLVPVAVALGSSARATAVIYGASLLVTLALCAIALQSLFGQPNI